MSPDHAARHVAGSEALAFRLILAQLNADGPGWIATYEEFADCPGCTASVMQAVVAIAAQEMTLPKCHDDDCAICDHSSDPDATAADEVAGLLVHIFDFIAKRGAGDA
jgi:hypothetical protein